MDKAGQVPAAAIAKRFIEAYYRVLHDNPELVHQFYLDHSEISRHGATGQADRVDAAGTQAIHDLISNCGFDKCTVLVDSADAQYSDNGAVVVMVAGHMGNKGQNRRPFVQTFVLARQNIDPPSFFVRNDVMRYTDTLPHLVALSAKPSSSPIPISSPPLSVPPNVSLDSKSPRPAVPSPRPAQPSPRPHIAPQPVQPEAAPVQAPQHEPEPEPSPPVEAEPAETEVVSASHSAQTLEPSQDQSLEAKPARKKREPRERRPKAPSAGAPSGTEEAKSKPRKKREGKKGKEETPAEQPASEPAAGSPTPAASASAAPAPSPPMPPSSWAALVTKATGAPVGAPSAVPEKPSATTANGAKPKAPSAPKAAPSKTPNGVPAPAVASDDKANGRSSANEDEKWQKVEKRDRGGDKAGPEKGWEEQGVALFINALPPNATEDEIRGLFSAYGEIRFCQIPPAPKGACYVHFAAPESVTKVMDSRPFHLHGEKLNVQRRKPIRPDGPRSESARGRGGRGGSFRGRGRGGSARGGRPSDAGTPPSGDAAAPVSESRPRRGRPAASPVAAAQ